MARPRIKQVNVSSSSDLEQTITSYIAQGFVVANKTATSAILQRRKKFSVLWAVIGFLLCILPFFIYLVLYATQPEFETVEIRLHTAR